MNSFLAALGAFLLALFVGYGVLRMDGISPPLLIAALVIGIGAGSFAFFSIRKFLNQLDDVQIQNQKAEEIKRLTHEDFTNLVVPVGINADEFKRTIVDARAKLRTVYDYATRISDKAVSSQLYAIITEGHTIIDEIKKDPKDYRIARTWFNTHLDQMKTITEKYCLDESMLLPMVKEQFVNTLTELKTNFIKLREDLIANDVNAFRIDMEVLNDQLKVENR
jgi:5-bromo-4-chloroindolyl phosphate hydrolysis protein